MKWCVPEEFQGRRRWYQELYGCHNQHQQSHVRVWGHRPSHQRQLCKQRFGKWHEGKTKQGLLIWTLSSILLLWLLLAALSPSLLHSTLRAPDQSFNKYFYNSSQDDKPIRVLENYDFANHNKTHIHLRFTLWISVKSTAAN